MTIFFSAKPYQPFFKGRIIKGSGKGSAQGIPTVNLDLADIPADLKEGIYAARVTIGGEIFGAAVHYGERPVHGLGRSFEAHLLMGNGRVTLSSPSPTAADEGVSKGRHDRVIRGDTLRRRSLEMGHEEYVSIELVKRLRDVRDFENEEELKKQIEKDIQETKKILEKPSLC